LAPAGKNKRAGAAPDGAFPKGNRELNFSKAGALGQTK
jgi:hypothetical protein